MILRNPDFWTPQSVRMDMSKTEYAKYRANSKKIGEVLNVLEVETIFYRERDTEVIMEMRPAPRGILTELFIRLIGVARFVTMRAEEFAQDLEDFGFKVEFS